jgi:hypothetical protein
LSLLFVAQPALKYNWAFLEEIKSKPTVR